MPDRVFSVHNVDKGWVLLQPNLPPRGWPRSPRSPADPPSLRVISGSKGLGASPARQPYGGQDGLARLGKLGAAADDLVVQLSHLVVQLLAPNNERWIRAGTSLTSRCRSSSSPSKARLAPGTCSTRGSRTSIFVASKISRRYL